MDAVDVAMTAHDWLAPVLAQDVKSSDLDVKVDLRAGLAWIAAAPQIQAGEGSLAAHVIRIAAGDRSLVGVPIFAARGFPHGNFLVKVDSPLTKLADLRGQRVGVAGRWTTTGNTWGRRTLRDEGVRPETVTWVAEAGSPAVPMGSNFSTTAGSTLDLLVDGQLDAVAANERLEDLATYRPHLRRLVPDYPAASVDYFQRTGLYPIFHIVLVRSEFAVAHPQVLHALWDLFQAARTQWFDHILGYEDGSPWAAAEIYRFTELFAGSWYQDGPTPALNDLTIRALVEELQVEGIVSTALAPAELFAEFLAAAK